MSGSEVIFWIIYFVWIVVYMVQIFLGYGTAYRKTKQGRDDGIGLFGWCMVFCQLAALVPGLGIWLWYRNKE